MQQTPTLALEKTTTIPAWWLDKSFLTNAISVLFVVAGYTSPIGQKVLRDIGYFALSGAITNWLAIYMLFEKVPGCYGSGVIPNRFEDFKVGIQQLIMNQFFTTENIQRFMNQQLASPATLDLSRITDALDFDRLFIKLTEAIRESSFGPMLAMFGGEKALDPLKPAFERKLREAIKDLSQDEQIQATLAKGLGQTLNGDSIRSHVESIVQTRLNELTPNMVKIIMQEMIQKHLGWLVVWGGVLGGLIGLLASLFR